MPAPATVSRSRQRQSGKRPALRLYKNLVQRPPCLTVCLTNPNEDKLATHRSKRISLTICVQPCCQPARPPVKVASLAYMVKQSAARPSSDLSRPEEYRQGQTVKIMPICVLILLKMLPIADFWSSVVGIHLLPSGIGRSSALVHSKRALKQLNCAAASSCIPWPASNACIFFTHNENTSLWSLRRSRLAWSWPRQRWPRLPVHWSPLNARLCRWQTTGCASSSARPLGPAELDPQ